MTWWKSAPAWGKVVATLSALAVLVWTMGLIVRPWVREVSREVAEEVVDDLRTEMDARFDAVDARFDAVDARFDALDARLDALDARFDALEGDIRLVLEHLLTNTRSAAPS